jgi:hypothetical protein
MSRAVQKEKYAPAGRNRSAEGECIRGLERAENTRVAVLNAEVQDSPTEFEAQTR